MKSIAIDLNGNKTYYRFNEDHIVCVHKDNEDLIYVYVLDNNKKILNYLWCKNTSMAEIEKIASEMLYELGYDGKIIEYNPYEGQAYYYLPTSNELEFPIDVCFYENNPPKFSPFKKETINSAKEYLYAMKKHKDNKDTLISVSSIDFDEISDNIYRINEYSDGASYELQYLSERIDKLIQKLGQRFEKNSMDQLNEAYEINKYIMDKMNKLGDLLPNGLHIEYPDK